MTAIKARPAGLYVVHHPVNDYLGHFIALDPTKDIILGKAADTFAPELFTGTAASRRQVRIKYEGDHVSFIGLRSRSPTSINGQIHTEGLLKSGDVIGLGDVVFVFQSHTENFGKSPIIPGVSALAFHIQHRIQATASNALPALIHGPLGTEKRRVGKGIHDTMRKSGAFVYVDCTQFSETDLKRRLFDHASTPISSGPSLLQAAINGTLFLDNAQDLAPDVFTEVIDKHGPCRLLVGVTQISEAFDDLPAIYLPSLGQRKEDIPHWIGAFCADFNCPRASWDVDLAWHFLGYAWPGNIDELGRIVRRLCEEIGDGNTWRLTTALKQRLSPTFTPLTPYSIDGLTPEIAVTQLRANGGRIHAAATVLNIKSTDLLRQLTEWNIDPSIFR
jgi:transcriptional regulator with PAS, ATPase and Fis domain